MARWRGHIVLQIHAARRRRLLIAAEEHPRLLAPDSSRILIHSSPVRTAHPAWLIPAGQKGLNSLLTASLNRNKRPRLRSDVIRLGTDQPIVGPLLYDMCRPAGHTRHYEDRRE